MGGYRELGKVVRDTAGEWRESRYAGAGRGSKYRSAGTGDVAGIE